MSSRVKITWKVEDGYINNGPHTLFYDKEEWENMSPEEKEKAVYEDAISQINIAWKEEKHA